MLSLSKNLNDQFIRYFAWLDTTPKCTFQTAPWLLDFLLKIQNLNYTAKRLTTIFNQRRHCFDYKKTLPLMYLNHLK